MPPLHPGEMLREEFMKPLGLSANALAMALRVPVTRITEILNERRSMTADMRCASRATLACRRISGCAYRLNTTWKLLKRMARVIRREVRPRKRDQEEENLRG